MVRFRRNTLQAIDKQYHKAVRKRQIPSKSVGYLPDVICSVFTQRPHFLANNNNNDNDNDNNISNNSNNSNHNNNYNHNNNNYNNPKGIRTRNPSRNSTSPAAHATTASGISKLRAVTPPSAVPNDCDGEGITCSCQLVLARQWQSYTPTRTCNNPHHHQQHVFASAVAV
ncbi:unnamed protein product [Polarella glacialis]|uniref:Uncharacterized protein n=1 Tax=Polarella glacialis TaxID=89957 RepID=A0A813HMJ0_POLGL|nr:unnamed protein product [Polarella glacialis]